MAILIPSTLVANQDGTLSLAGGLKKTTFTPGTGIDWDPNEHPRDSEGKFTNKPGSAGVFIFGKAKKATFTGAGGKQYSVPLNPGETAYKPKPNYGSGVYVVKPGFANKDTYDDTGKKISSDDYVGSWEKKYYKQEDKYENLGGSPEGHQVFQHNGQVYWSTPYGKSFTVEPGEKVYVHDGTDAAVHFKNDGTYTVHLASGKTVTHKSTPEIRMGFETDPDWTGAEPASDPVPETPEAPVAPPKNGGVSVDVNGKKIKLGPNQAMYSFVGADGPATTTIDGEQKQHFLLVQNGNPQVHFAPSGKTQVAGQDGQLLPSGWKELLTDPGQETPPGATFWWQKVAEYDSTPGPQADVNAPDPEPVVSAPNESAAVQSEFTHPVSGKTFPIPDGWSLWQHNASPNSFAIVEPNVGPEGDHKFVNKFGQKLQKLPTNYYKQVLAGNYTKVTDGGKPQTKKVEEPKPAVTPEPEAPTAAKVPDDLLAGGVAPTYTPAVGKVQSLGSQNIWDWTTDQVSKVNNLHSSHYGENGKWGHLSESSQLAIVADNRQFFADVLATIEAAKNDKANYAKLDKSEKTALTKEQKRFALLLKNAELAEGIRTGTIDPEELKAGIAELEPKMSGAESGKTFGTYSSYPQYKYFAPVENASAKYVFQKSVEELPFDVYNGSLTDYQLYLSNKKGFEYTAGLTLEEAKAWTLHELNAPNSHLGPSKIEKLKASGKAAVIGAQAVAAMKKAAKVTPEEPKVKEESIFSPGEPVEVAQKKAQLKAKTLSLGYLGKGPDVGLGWAYHGPDNWAEYSTSSGSATGAVLTDFEMVKKLEEGNLVKDPSINATLGKFSAKKFAKAAYGGDPWDLTLSKKELNALLQENGGEYLGFMKNDAKKAWLGYHANGNVLGTYMLEEAVTPTTKNGKVPHKDASTHAGSLQSPSGKVSAQALADIIGGKDWYEQVKAANGSTAGLSDEDAAEVKSYLYPYGVPEEVGQTFAADLLAKLPEPQKIAPGPDKVVVYTKDGYTLSPNGDGTWTHTSPSGNVLHNNITQKLVDNVTKAENGWATKSSAEASSTETKTPTASLDKPANEAVTEEAWALVQQAEGNIDSKELDKLLEGSTDNYSPWEIIGSVPQTSFAKFPAKSKSLLSWAYNFKGGASSLPLAKLANGIVEAYTEKANKGDYVSPNSTKYEYAKKTWHLPPGSKVMALEGDDDPYVIGPNAEWGFWINWNGSPYNMDAWALDKFKNDAIPPGYTVTLEAQKNLDFPTAKEDGLKIDEATFNAAVQFEKDAKFEAGFTESEYYAGLIKNKAAYLDLYPNASVLYENLATLPANTKAALQHAFVDNNKPLIDVLSWKANNGAYTINPGDFKIPANAPYADLVAKGKTKDQHVLYEWTPNAIAAYGKDHDLLLANDGSQTDAKLIADHIAGIGEVEPAFNSTPDELVLTKTSKGLKGMHSKTVWKDQNGNEWMSKGFPNDPNGPARIDAEHEANVISRMYGFGAPKTQTMMLEGKYVYLQHLAPADKDLQGYGPNDLSEQQLIQTMQEHVLDWLVSNHDSHPENFLIDPQGNVFGIDKGQAWRWFPSDKLAVGYLPSGNPVPVWYDKFYKAVQNGQIKEDKARAIAQAVVAKAYQVQRASQDAFRTRVEAAMAKRTTWPSEYPSRELFVDAVVARKATIGDDFLNFYKKDVFSKAGIIWDAQPDDFKVTQLNPHTHVELTPEFAQDVMQAGAHGKSVFFAGDHVEDGHAVVWVEKVGKTVGDGDDNLKGELKLRAGADKAFTKWLKAQTIEHDVTASSSTSYQPKQDFKNLPGNNVLHSAILGEIKTINTHAQDGAYNQGTLDQAKINVDNMNLAAKKIEEFEKANPTKVYDEEVFGQKFVTHEQVAAWQEMVKSYNLAHQAALEAKESGTKVGFTFEQVTYSPTAGVDKAQMLQESIVDANGNMAHKFNNGPFLMVPKLGGKPSKISKSEYTSLKGEGWQVSNASVGVPEKYVNPTGTGWWEKQSDGTWKFGSNNAALNQTMTQEEMDQAIADQFFDGWTHVDGKPGAFLSPPTYSHGIYGTFTKVGDNQWEKTNANGFSENKTFTDVEVQNAIQTSFDPDEWDFDPGLPPDGGVFEEVSNKVDVGGTAVKVTRRKARSTQGTFDVDSGQLIASGGDLTYGNTGHQYEIEFGNVRIDYRPWEGEQVKKAQQGLLRFQITGWDGQAQSIAPVIDKLRQIGLKLDAADESSLELLYWNQLTGIARDRKGYNQGNHKAALDKIDAFEKNNPNASDSERLAALKDAWTGYYGKNVVDNVDFMPRFSKANIQGNVASDDKEFTSGRPYWMRPDFTKENLEKLKTQYGKTLPVHSFSSHNAMGIAQSGGLISTEERIRVLGQFIEGMSSGSDQGHGSSAFLYFRQNLKYPSDNGIVLEPSVVFRMHNYAFAGDLFGEIDSRKDSAPFDVLEASKFSGSTNEIMIKNNVSLLDDIAFLVVSQASDRAAIIKWLKQRGISEIRGMKVEDRIVGSASEAAAKYEQVWAAALAELSGAGK